MNNRYRTALCFLALVFFFLGSLPYPQAVSAQTGTNCPGALSSRLTPGGGGKVTPGSPNNVRNQPTIAGQKIGQIEPGTQFEVLEGPVCADGYAWWHIRYSGSAEGWTVESYNGQYALEPTASAVSANIAVGASNTNVTVDPAQGLTLIETGADGIYQILFSPDGQSLVARTSDRLYKFDVATGSLLSQMNEEHPDPVNQYWFVAGDYDLPGYLIDLWSQTDFTIRNLDLSSVGMHIRDLDEMTNKARLSDDGTLLVRNMSSQSGTGVSILVYDLSSGVPQPITVLEDPEAGSTTGVGKLMISANNQQVMGGSYSGFVVWDIQSGEIIKRIDLYTDGLRYSPDRKYALTIDNEVWDISSGRKRFTIGSQYAPGHFNSYEDIQFSADNRTIAAIVELEDFNAGTPATLDIQVMDGSTGKVIRTVASYARGGDSNVYNSLNLVDISPDGRYVAAASDWFGTIMIWDTQVEPPDVLGCMLTVKRDTTARSEPSVTATQSRTLVKGEEVTANGQAQDTTGFTWYRLTDMTWVRAETVDASPECGTLPVVN